MGPTRNRSGTYLSYFRTTRAQCTVSRRRRSAACGPEGCCRDVRDQVLAKQKLKISRRSELISISLAPANRSSCQAMPYSSASIRPDFPKGHSAFEVSAMSPGAGRTRAGTLLLESRMRTLRFRTWASSSILSRPFLADHISISSDDTMR